MLRPQLLNPGPPDPNWATTHNYNKTKYFSGLPTANRFLKYSDGLIVNSQGWRYAFYDASYQTRLRGGSMLYWALVFLIVAIIAAIFGFGGVAVAAAGIAKLLFFIFLVVFVITLITGLTRRGRTPGI
jgi:uncharacterized membrane protein YtjA (UPF0391 family)